MLLASICYFKIKHPLSSISLPTYLPPLALPIDTQEEREYFLEAKAVASSSLRRPTAGPPSRARLAFRKLTPLSLTFLVELKPPSGSRGTPAGQPHSPAEDTRKGCKACERGS